MEFQTLNEESFYFSQDLFDEELPFSLDVDEISEENNRIEVPIFREGTFGHYWWGDLVFDMEYLERIVYNFNRRVNPQKISLNVDHIASKGAKGWLPQEEGAVYIKPLTFSTPEGKVRKNFLFCKFDLNAEGIEICKKRTYAYFSAEIHPDFATPEKFVDENGDEVTKKYGPALTGCAFTNRPFIPNLPGMFSNGVVPDADRQEMSHAHSPDTRSWLSFVKDKKPVDDPVNDPVKPQNPEPIPFNNGDKNMEDFFAQLDATTDAAGRMSVCQKFSTDSNPGVAKFAAKMLEKERELAATELALNDSVRKAENAKADAAAQMQQIADLKLSLAQAQTLSFNSSVDLLCSKLEKDRHYPAVVTAVREFSRELNTEQRELKFSVGDSKGGILEVIDYLFSKIPDEGRVDLNDGNIDPTPVVPHNVPNPTPTLDPANTPNPTPVDEYSDLFAKYQQLYSVSMPRMATREEFDKLVSQNRIDKETGKVVPKQRN